MAIAVNRVVFARRGYWTISSILVMVVKNYYRPGSEEEEVDCKENLKLYSERVAIERLKDMIENHAEAGTLPSKFNDQGERIFVSKGFKDWWFKYDMKTFVKSLNFEASNALYQVFEEMEKIGVASDPGLKNLIEHSTSTDQPEAKSEKHGFPQIDKWTQLTLCTLEDGQMEVSVAGEPFGVEDLKEMMPGHLHTLLFHIVARGKIFNNTSFSEEVFKKEYVKRLRDRLKKIFKINEDPIPYNKKAKAYEIRFKCESDFPTESFSPKDATPPGVSRKIKRPDEQF